MIYNDPKMLRFLLDRAAQADPFDVVAVVLLFSALVLLGVSVFMLVRSRRA